MRRVSPLYANKGMVLGRDVYDSRGQIVAETGSSLNADLLGSLRESNIGEILVQDYRIADVPVSTMFPPEIEAGVSRTLFQLITASESKRELDRTLTGEAEKSIRQMIRELFPEPLGEFSITGCDSEEEYRHSQPPKVAALSLLMARRLGYGMFELDSLGMAALLKDIGYVLVGDDENGADRSEREESRRIRQHPSHGSRILAQSQGFSSETINAVLQHHERWDGSGYPEGLKADAISPFARIIAIADTYCELLSAKPKRRALMPHEAIEYVMAFSAEWFDPEMVQLFVRQVPLYPSGLMVRLNTKEVGIVSDANVGHIGRPVVRICQDIHGQEIDRPYDVDLSGSKQQDLLIVGVLER